MVRDQFDQAVQIAEQEGSPFVGGEPPCEADGQDLAVQQPVGVPDLFRWFAVAEPLGVDPLS